jgi:CheY-like chemotaxis protein
VEEDIIDVIISDISLPDEDGYDFIRMVRASSAHVALPMIALTGYAAISDSENIFRAGFQRHMTKPFDRQELIATIVDLVA